MNGIAMSNLKNNIGYGSGDFALNLFWQGTGFYLFFYFTDVVGLPNVVAGTVFAVGGLWDAVTDPAMGYVAERTKSRWGRYRPYLLFGSVPLGLSLILLFSLPALEGSTTSWVVALLALILFRTCYTVVSIPYSTLGARMTTNSDERTRLSAIRMYCAFLGGVSVIGVAALLQSYYPDGQAFKYLGIFCAIAGTIVLFLCFSYTAQRVPRDTNTSHALSFGQLISSLSQNKPFLVLLIGIVFVSAATTVVTTTVLYIFEHVFGDRMMGNNAILIMTGAPLITIPIWSALALRFGKKAAWATGCVVSIVGFLSLYWTPSSSIVFAMISYCIITLGLSSFSVLFWSMLPDTIEYGEYMTGVRNESTIIGFVSSAQKLALATSVFLLGLMLDAVGYSAGVEQSDVVVDGLLMVVCLTPCFALFAALISIMFYPITARSHGEMVLALKDKAPL